MPATFRFDTLDYANQLEQAGVPKPQAEAQAKVLGDVLAKCVVFPGDLVILTKELSSKIEASENQVTRKIEKVALDQASSEQRLMSAIQASHQKLSNQIESTELKLLNKIEAASGKRDTFYLMASLALTLSLAAVGMAAKSFFH